MYRKLIVVFALTTPILGSLLDGDFDLANGVTLKSIPVSNSLEDEGRSFGENSALFRMAKFLQGHEIHVKLPNLIEKDKLSQVLAESLKAVDDTYKENAETGRGKGGGGGLALLAMMMAKAMGAAAIGALGLLTMKALAAAGLALVLAALVGVKKLSSHDDHHEDHQVIYAGHHGHHRRRRDLDTPLPYRAWKEYQKNM